MSEIMQVVRFDADAASAVTYMTDASSQILNPPSEVDSVASTKLEFQLNFLAKQLEIERQRREKLQYEVESMHQKLRKVEHEGKLET